MSKNPFEQVIFGVYEILSDILPGFILLTTILFFYDISIPSSIPTSLHAILLIFLAFIIGQVIHCISSELERYINRWKYGGYPSALYMTDDDNTFPQYFKDKIRKQLKIDYETPLDSEPQHIFEMCYTYVTQNNISNRVMIFLNMYTFSRNIMLVILIEGIFLATVASIKYDVLLGLLATLTLISSFFFYHRFITYAESFAKEVFRSYFVNKVGKENQEG